MSDFENGLISRIFGVLWRGFLQKPTIMLLQNRFSYVFCIFKFGPKMFNFAKAIAFARWPILKMVSFLEHLVFFGAVFCTDQL